MYDIVYLPVARKDLMLAVIQSMSDPISGMNNAMELVDAFEQSIDSLREMLFLPNDKPEGIEQKYRMLQTNGYSAYFDIDEQSRTIQIMRILKSEQ